jgi:hypothetical protein
VTTIRRRTSDFSRERRRYPVCANQFPVLLPKIPCSGKKNSLLNCTGNLMLTPRICFQIRADFGAEAIDFSNFPVIFPVNREFALQTGSPGTGASAKHTYKS